MPDSLKSLIVALGLLIVLQGIRGQDSACRRPIRFKITLDQETNSKPTGGRLFAFMSESGDSAPASAESVRDKGWVAAMEVERFVPGQTLEFNPDLKAFPRPFSQAKTGAYQFTALLDPDHSYAYNGPNEGDWYGPVVRVENLNPSDTNEIGLALNKRTEPKIHAVDVNKLKLIEFQSPLLSHFWGRPIQMRAAVVLPPSFSQKPKRTYPAIYVVHGFGGNHILAASQGVDQLNKLMIEGRQMEMAAIFLDGSFPTGHHEFADSVNNGPWGKALTAEFIPYLEKKFRLISKPYARFLTGHSSGGWSTLWLQVTYSNYFGGTWSTSPDPVDLRSFTGVNVSPASTENVYHRQDGTPRNLVRQNGKPVLSFEEYAKREEVLGEYGGQLASFEWVWSPKGQDGRPMKLFSRETGEQDPFVQQAWQRYDIRMILEQNWRSLGPNLQGKIHLVCGSEDTFHLEEAVILLCDLLKKKGFAGACEIVPGRDHGNLYQNYKTYPDGLYVRIAKEMEVMFKTNSERIVTRRSSEIPKRAAR